MAEVFFSYQALNPDLEDIDREQEERELEFREDEARELALFLANEQVDEHEQ